MAPNGAPNDSKTDSGSGRSEDDAKFATKPESTSFSSGRSFFVEGVVALSKFIETVCVRDVTITREFTRVTSGRGAHALSTDNSVRSNS